MYWHLLLYSQATSTSQKGKHGGVLSSLNKKDHDAITQSWKAVTSFERLAHLWHEQFPFPASVIESITIIDLFVHSRCLADGQGCQTVWHTLHWRHLVYQHWVVVVVPK